jgi:protein TonB
MRNPIATPAALLFNESLVITRPAARLRSGWLGLSVGLHLLAGSAFLVMPYFRFEPLERPSLDKKNIVFLGSPAAAPPLRGNGQKAENHPPAVKSPESRPKSSILSLPKVIQDLIAPKTESAAPDNSAAGPGTDKDGVDWGIPGGQGDKDSIGVDPNAKGKGGGGSDDSQNGIFSASYPPSEPPELVTRVEPIYPESARAQGIEGWVFLEIVIDESGQIADARIMRSDNALFNQAALTAIRRWKYTSPRNDRRAVKVYKTVGIKFTLH